MDSTNIRRMYKRFVVADVRQTCSIYFLLVKLAEVKKEKGSYI